MCRRYYLTFLFCHSIFFYYFAFECNLWFHDAYVTVGLNSVMLYICFVCDPLVKWEVYYYYIIILDDDDYYYSFWSVFRKALSTWCTLYCENWFVNFNTFSNFKFCFSLLLQQQMQFVCLLVNRIGLLVSVTGLVILWLKASSLLLCWLCSVFISLIMRKCK